MQHEPTSMGEVLGELDELASTHDEVCVADVLDDFGERSFGPFIMLPALLEITPIGGIPGLPTALALFIALIATAIAARFKSGSKQDQVYEQPDPAVASEKDIAEGLEPATIVEPPARA